MKKRLTTFALTGCLGLLASCDKAKETADKAAAEAKQAAETVKADASKAGEAAKDAIAGAVDKGKELAADAADKAKEALAGMQDSFLKSLGDLPDQVKSVIETKDISKAKELLPKLQELVPAWDQLKSKLSPDLLNTLADKDPTGLVEKLKALISSAPAEAAPAPAETAPAPAAPN